MADPEGGLAEARATRRLAAQRGGESAHHQAMVDRHPQHVPHPSAAVELAQQGEPAGHALGEMRGELADLVSEDIVRAEGPAARQNGNSAGAAVTKRVFCRPDPRPMMARQRGRSNRQLLLDWALATTLPSSSRAAVGHPLGEVVGDEHGRHLDPLAQVAVRPPHAAGPLVERAEVGSSSSSTRRSSKRTGPAWRAAARPPRACRNRARRTRRPARGVREQARHVRLAAGPPRRSGCSPPPFPRRRTSPAAVAPGRPRAAASTVALAHVCSVVANHPRHRPSAEAVERSRSSVDCRSPRGRRRSLPPSEATP